MGSGAAGGGLRTIFSFFLGLMLVSFIGVGAYTFHPPPEAHQDRGEEFHRRTQEVQRARPWGELTPAEQEEVEAIEREQREIAEADMAARNAWGLRTSIILIVFATLAMAVSLIRADQLPVISNGLLLGGVFTMVYGVGWIITTDQTVTRFAIMTVALMITLGLGWVRFVRAGEPPPAAGGAGTGEEPHLPDIERRLRDLEQRMDGAASALRPRGRAPGRE
jgi:hypothetical protein